MTTYRPPTREEVAAMWLYSTEYAAQNLSIIEWWAKQPPSRHRSVADMLRQLDKAATRDAVLRG